MSDHDEATPQRRKIKLRSLRRLKREGKDMPHHTVLRRRALQSRRSRRPRGGWRTS